MHSPFPYGTWKDWAWRVHNNEEQRWMAVAIDQNEVDEDDPFRTAG